MSSFSFYRDFLYYFLFQSNEGELEDLADLQDTVKNFFTSILFFLYLRMGLTLPFIYLTILGKFVAERNKTSFQVFKFFVERGSSS